MKQMRSIIAMFCGAVLTGCVGLQPPTAELVSARVTDVDDRATRLVLDVRLTNPNDQALPMPRIDYRVTLEDGVEAYAAYDRPAEVMPPNGRQMVQLPAVVAMKPGHKPAQPWKADGAVTYRPDRGWQAFLFETGFPLPKAGFSGRGVLRP